MDPVSKTRFEQRMVVILLVIFIACFVSLLRRLGFIGGKARSAAPTAVGVGAPAGEPAPVATQAVEQHRQRLDEVETLGLGTVATAVQPGRPRRDPLVSLLPSESPSAETSAQTEATPTVAVDMTADETPSPPPLTVRGMVVGGQRPQALIDEGVYEVGDLVKGARILAIEREGILVSVSGVLYRLSPNARAELVKRVTDREVRP